MGPEVTLASALDDRSNNEVFLCSDRDGVSGALMVVLELPGQESLVSASRIHLRTTITSRLLKKA